MKKQMKNKKIILLTMIIVIVIMIVGTSYALWQLSLRQTKSNAITSGCFKIEFTDKNPISLTNAFPISDSEAKKLTPYDFTITNTCTSYASYQINLEILNDSTLTDLSTVKMMLNESGKEKEPLLLSSNNIVTKTLNNAKTSYKLETGYLNHKESKTFELRLWLDEKTEAKDTFMDKTLASKITVTSSYVSDKNAPNVDFKISANESSILIDASNSFDEESVIDKYYYSIDNENFIESKSSTHEFTNLPYRKYTISVKVSDAFGKMSEVKRVDTYPKVNAVNYVKSLNGSGEVLTDQTDENNTRYVGINPNNYVSFNNELWRIIGVMNSINNGDGKIESRLKIIRSTPIGSYSWDSSYSYVNYGYGVNEWSTSSAMYLLNPGNESKPVGGSLYFNRNSGTCNNKESNSSISCDFTKTGMQESAKQLIENAVWNTGTNGSLKIEEGITTVKFYQLERSSNKGKMCTGGDVCNDEIPRKTTWTGIVGLMYPSDYGYATSGGTTTSRTSCLNISLYNWSDSSAKECRENNWLYKRGTFQWTMTPYATTDNAVYSTFIYDTGKVDAYDSCSAYSISPTVYLKSNISITGGEGTSISPYTLSEK